MENMDLDFHFPTDLPDTSFDVLADPNLFFDFDTYSADGPAPESNPTEPVAQADDVAMSDFTSLFTGIEATQDTSAALTLLDEQQQQQQRPATIVQPSLPLVLPTTQDKDNCSTDVAKTVRPSDTLLADPTLDQDPFALLNSWPADKVDTSCFVWNTEGLETEGLDLSGGLGFFQPNSFDNHVLPNNFQNGIPPSNFAYPSPRGTEVVTAPTNAASLGSFFPDIESVSAGEIPFTLDQNAVSSFLSSLPPFIADTPPQPTTIINTTPALQHPRPITHASPKFIVKTESEAESPAPLSIIDERGHVRATPVSSVSLTPKARSQSLATPVVNGKVIKRIPRPAKAKDVNASEWYEALPAAPAAWGGSDPKNPLFRYNSQGEWWPGLRVGRDELLHYLTERKRLSLPLTLWVQNLPHGCVNRVADGRTLKCRWDGCPAQNGTILKGFWRVCFDERPATSGRQHNPFHNAGYMHLWCLDRCFDLFEISQAFDLRPDTRHFEKEERNPMAMTRDHDELVMEFEDWRSSQQKSYEAWRALAETNRLLGLPTENRVVEREEKLWHRLTTRHLALETVVRQTMRDTRGGISIDQHKGDVGWYSKMVNERKRQTREQREAGSRALARLGDCDEIFSEDERVQQSRMSKSRQRGTKRKAVETTSDENDKENAGDQSLIIKRRKA